MSVYCHLAICLEFSVSDEQGNITFENLSTNCQSKIKSNSSQAHTACLSRMGIDYVPIKANMTHTEWKSIDSICIISLILLHCLREGAMKMVVERDVLCMFHNTVLEFGKAEDGPKERVAKETPDASIHTQQPQLAATWPKEGPGEEILCSADSRDIQGFSIEEADCTKASIWTRHRRGPFPHYGQVVCAP